MSIDARHLATSPPISSHFVELVGAAGVETGPGTRAFRADNIAPECVVFPTSLDELSRCVAAANAAGLATIPAGNGTHLGVGRVPTRYDVAISMRRMRTIVAHEAADMTVTVEAGVTLDELNRALAVHGQWLPLDPPHPEAATIGALIAGDASGPLRLAHGTVRDLLIGITAVLADGSAIHGGGRVVKNVAGYDLMKLFTGSLGTLGIIAQATFKVRPRTAHEVLWIVSADDSRAAAALALDVVDGPIVPFHVDVLSALAAGIIGASPDSAAVLVGCGGTPEETAVQGQRLEEIVGAQRVRACGPNDAPRLYAALRNFPADVGLFGCRVSLLPTQLGDLLAPLETRAQDLGLRVATVAHAGNGIAWVRVPGGLSDSDAFASYADWLRTAVHSLGGFAVFDLLPAGSKGRVDPWGADVPGLALMRGVKTALDPRQCLSPGRFVEGL